MSSMPNSATDLARTVADKLGLPDLRHHLPLIVALAVDAVGSGTKGPLLLLFLTRVIDLDLRSAGLLLSVSALVSLVVPAMIGQLTHRISPRTIVIGAQLVQGVAMLGLLFSRDVPVIAVAATLSAIGGRAFWSSVFALVAAAADDEPEDRRGRWFAASGMIQNSGFALGGLLAGALLLLDGSTPFLVALALNAVTFFGSALLFATERRPAPTTTDEHGSGVRVWTDGRYLLLIAANTLFAFCSVLLMIGLPVYLLDFLDAPRWLLGPLLAMVTILGATCQGLGVRLTRSLRSVTVMAVAGGFWIVWGLLSASLMLAGAGWLIIGGLVLAVLCYAIAELLHAPASMNLAASEAPKEARASYLSVFQYSFAIASIATPAVFGGLAERGAALPWLIAAAAAAAAIVLIFVSVRGRGQDTPASEAS